MDINNSTQKFVNELLSLAGITINGRNPWDIQILNDQFFNRVIRDGTLGLGESYMDKWWDCERMDIFIERIVSAHLDKKVKQNFRFILKSLLAKIINYQTKKRAKQVGERHYDIGNDLFTCMLDSQMNYTCGYWKTADNLDDAQIAKMKLSCEKLLLKPGMRLLDIGCGWGALAKYAAKHYGVEVVGITISKQQQFYAQENCAGYPIEIRLQDYRDVNEKFDRIVSLGMFEHVGHLNYRQYMEIVHHSLNENGLFLLHTIGTNVTYYTSNEWIKKYIFPNGMLPSIPQIGKAAERLFVMEDWHNFGADYDKTLMAWQQNFNNHWDELKNKYGERFYRMWNFYLLSSAGDFRARDMQLWQILFSKNGLKGGYRAPR